MGRRYSSEVVYCGEDDLHFPNLSVGHTARFGLHLRGDRDGASGAEFVEHMTDKLLHSLDIPHTKNTIVGDSFVRGVSGGERRRVSLAESLVSNPVVACWDNPIRGLDSSAALKFLRTLKKVSRATGMANVVTLYQTSETMYAECFDRVMSLYEGRMIFCGRATEAKQYFIDLGFFCHSRQTTAEFLTAVTSPIERVTREDHQGHVPLDPDALAKAFRDSSHYAQLGNDMAEYKSQFSSDPSNVKAFIAEHSRLRSRWTVTGAPQPGSVMKQALLAAWRHFLLLWGDRRSSLTGLFMTVVTAVINGSAFYMAPKTSTGSFMKGGGIFFSLIYFFLNALPQLSSTVTSRSILAKQHRLGFIHPLALTLGLTLADLPLALLEVTAFSLPYYFLLGLRPAAGAFLTFLLTLFLAYAAALSLFRALGAWSPNSSTALLVGGAALPVLLAYSGYAPPVPTMPGWGAWIRRISPSPWALEALLANEFAGIELHCSDNQLVPSGAGYGEGDAAWRGCPLPGAAKGRAVVQGERYLEDYFEYRQEHVWRNVGVIVAIWAVYVVVAAVGLSVMVGRAGADGGVVFKRGAARAEEEGLDGPEEDVERRGQSAAQGERSGSSLSSKGSSRDSEKDDGSDGEELGDPAAASAFSFENVAYTIVADGREKRLLDGVTGIVRPGQLTALMGASGAGKTTLLDTLAQRKSEGRVDGTVLLDGKPLDGSFGRACGFCMQQDVHEPNATVREALQFSAVMRQDASVPEGEKLALVWEAWGVEERKRVTIGVELAARPSALLFLDEPTSGLDSQGAFSIVRFLQRIAAQGIPVICTIHQPSGIIFNMFDHVLLLAPGGKTLYFGETGQNCHKVVDYFARHGAVMGEFENPAEFIINTATSKDDPSKDWARTWSESPENQELLAEISEYKSTSSSAQDRGSQPTSSQAFALPLKDQIIKVTHRHWISVWRDGPYNFSKLFKSIFCELFIAFTFFHSDTTLQGTQNRMLFFLLISWLVPAIVPDIQAVWFEKRAIHAAREKNGVYSAHALTAALVLVELPWQLLNLTIVFLCIYWTVGYPNASSVAGYEYLMFVLLGVFGTGFAQVVAALFPREKTAGYANSLTWVVLTAFTGAAIPHAVMTDFYRPWMFWVDPLRYFVSGSAANVLRGTPVEGFGGICGILCQ
ncbi:ABC transporter pmr5 [Neofusicoccum parvum]|uniref:ABC transporter pmr5 n=1 Tax=Neofusicoccum parvum TaxID=310453 RepID=A0ACB5SH86_9PEZI|nr:ABC transporter pmr5 [Neofusicoccum parvum]